MAMCKVCPALLRHLRCSEGVHQAGIGRREGQPSAARRPSPRRQGERGVPGAAAGHRMMHVGRGGGGYWPGGEGCERLCIRLMSSDSRQLWQLQRVLRWLRQLRDRRGRGAIGVSRLQGLPRLAAQGRSCALDLYVLPTVKLTPRVCRLAQGVNIMQFCKEYNARTQDKMGQIIPVEITVFEVCCFGRKMPN